jgi:hypothetical protein
MIGPSTVNSVASFVEEMKRYQALGFNHFFVPLPFWSGNLNSILRLMDEFAQQVGM